MDLIDLELSTEDVDEFVNCVQHLGPSFGGINLEDIKAPECFLIESQLREIMDIPVFHDDQHGTAIIAAAGFINALDLTGRNIEETKLVVNGAGSAGIACIELLKAFGMKHDNILLCDTRGVIYQGREEGMNQWKSAHAANTEARTLEEAMEGADSFSGYPSPGRLPKIWSDPWPTSPSSSPWPTPIRKLPPGRSPRSAQGRDLRNRRSDYPNQVNNVLGFPYIFRGALDVRARTINDEMKIAAAKALVSWRAKTSLTKSPPPIPGAAYATDRTTSFRCL